MKRGICPIPLPVDVCEEENDDECTLDSDCFGDMKCCSDSCQKLCVQPPQSKLNALIHFSILNRVPLTTVNSRYCGHSRDRDLVSILARVRNSGVREKKNRKCIGWIYGRRKYLDRLVELIQGDETAKLAYEEKHATRKARAMASNGSRL